MRYEIHLTLNKYHPELHLLEELYSVKVTHIVLSHGEHIFQPMLTFYREGSDVNQVFNTYDHIIKFLENLKIKIIRTKIEIGINKPTNCIYMEQHIKIEINLENFSDIIKFCNFNNLVISRNILKPGLLGNYYFLSQRKYLCSFVQGNVEFNQTLRLLSDFSKGHFEILDYEKELVVYDDNKDLDKGWL